MCGSLGRMRVWNHVQPNISMNTVAISSMAMSLLRHELCLYRVDKAESQIYSEGTHASTDGDSAVVRAG